MLIDGSVHDPVARLLAQAERIRAYLVEGRDEAQIISPVAALMGFLAVEKQGLWFDQLDANGRFVEEPARATSLYHIIGAVTELTAALRVGGEVRQTEQERSDLGAIRSSPRRIS